MSSIIYAFSQVPRHVVAVWCHPYPTTHCWLSQVLTHSLQNPPQHSHSHWHWHQLLSSSLPSTHPSKHTCLTHTPTMRTAESYQLDEQVRGVRWPDYLHVSRSFPIMWPSWDVNVDHNNQSFGKLDKSILDSFNSNCSKDSHFSFKWF